MAGSSRASWFTRFANGASRATGKPGTFVLALIVVIVWAVTGPIFRFSDTSQLIINTGTTIVTFLMVFLIQNTQNRDTAAVQLKLDELIRVTENARNDMLALDKLTDAELDAMREKFVRLGKVGGVGVAEIEEAEASLEQASGGLQEASAEVKEAAEDLKKAGNSLWPRQAREA